jgi:hypothetical protein
MFNKQKLLLCLSIYRNYHDWYNNNIIMYTKHSVFFIGPPEVILEYYVPNPTYHTYIIVWAFDN